MSSPTPADEDRDGVGPENAELSAPDRKPLITWDVVVSGVLFLALVVEQVKLVQRITPAIDSWLQQPYTVVSGVLVLSAAALTVVRIKLRRLSYWVMLLSLVAVPVAVVLFTALFLLAKYSPS